MAMSRNECERCFKVNAKARLFWCDTCGKLVCDRCCYRDGAYIECYGCEAKREAEVRRQLREEGVV